MPLRLGIDKLHIRFHTFVRKIANKSVKFLLGLDPAFERVLPVGAKIYQIVEICVGVNIVQYIGCFVLALHGGALLQGRHFE